MFLFFLYDFLHGFRANFFSPIRFRNRFYTCWSSRPYRKAVVHVVPPDKAAWVDRGARLAAVSAIFKYAWHSSMSAALSLFVCVSHAETMSFLGAGGLERFVCENLLKMEICLWNTPRKRTRSKVHQRLAEVAIWKSMKFSYVTRWHSTRLCRTVKQPLLQATILHDNPVVVVECI